MATAAVAAPATAFRNLRHLALASFWFGLFFHWQPIISVLIPAQVAEYIPKGGQGSAAGLLYGAGAFFGAAVPPLVGAWSDRLRTPWGRRRPIIVVGVAGNLVGLAVMMLAPGYGVFLAGIVITQIFNNGAGAAYSAMIPDIVPDGEFGRASGFLAAMVLVGQVLGLFTTLGMALLGNLRLTYVAIAIILVLSALPTLAIAGRDTTEPSPEAARRLTWAAVKEFFAPMASGDFAWVIFTRALMTGGVWAIFPFLFFFFRDVVRVDHPDQFQSIWLLIVLVAAMPFGAFGGAISDRYGRKRFVYASGALQSLVALVFIALFPTAIPLVIALGVAYGVGYGLYYAVDWALACDTLPDPTKSAKDMGLFHVAVTLPQTIVPGLAGPVLDAFNRQSANSGYRVVFASAIAFFVLGTVLVSRIRSVR